MDNGKNRSPDAVGLAVLLYYCITVLWQRSMGGGMGA